MKRRQRPLRYYPIAVNLRKKPTLIIGGGKVAERKIGALRRAGAKVRVVSPTLTPLLRRLAKEKDIEWIRRRARAGDIKGTHIVVAATNDSSINRKVSRWAREKRVWINVVDKAALSDFISPAVFHADKGIVTVYTDGKDPVLSRDLKNFLKERWDDFLLYRNRL
jgi:siroheme synthase-like protein